MKSDDEFVVILESVKNLRGRDYFYTMLLMQEAGYYAVTDKENVSLDDARYITDRRGFNKEEKQQLFEFVERLLATL